LASSLAISVLKEHISSGIHRYQWVRVFSHPDYTLRR